MAGLFARTAFKTSGFLKLAGYLMGSEARASQGSNMTCEGIRSLSQKAVTDHPWISKVPAPASFLPEERVLTFLAANVAAGKLSNVAVDWEHLPAKYHSFGMEIVLQTHLFAGFPRVINALATVHQVGVDKSDPTWTKETHDTPAWRKSGGEVLKTIYAGGYDKLRVRMGELHPVLDKMMEEHGYGRVLSRPGGPSLRLRELCVIAVLAGQDVAPQLASHLRGALRAGATQEEIAAAVAQTDLVWGPAAQAQAAATLKSLPPSKPKK